MIIGYLRISSPDQNPTSQRELLLAAGCEQVFEETASGARLDRPVLAEVLRTLRTGDQLTVFKLDRLARSTRQLIQTVDELEQRGIKLRSLTEAIDTSSASGRFFLNVLSAVSEFERQAVKERVRAGIDSARAHGRIGGRPRAMTEQDIKAAKALLKDGAIPVTEVAKRLGIGLSTLYRTVPGGRSAA